MIHFISPFIWLEISIYPALKLNYWFLYCFFCYKMLVFVLEKLWFKVVYKYFLFYLYHKLLNIKKRPFNIELYCYIYFAGCSCLLCLISKNIYYIVCFPALIILFFVFIKIYTHTNYKTALITTVIALGISLCSFTFSAVIMTLFLLCTALTPENHFWILIKLVIGIMQYLLVHLPFQLKRLKKGMPFLYELNFNNIGCLLSMCIIICVIIISTPYTIHTYITISCLLLIFPCALLLISWWRAIITRNYHRKLQQFEMQKLKNELVQKEQEITRLLENNNALAQIIHRDNKLIPAMELAVNTFLQNRNTLSPQQLKEQGLALAAHLQTMSQERKFNLTEYQTNGQPFLPEFFQDFGLKAHTTHAGNGGSGIGLMGIWKLKKKYRASLVITEYAPGTYSYTKQISLIFDAKKHYIIQTYRKHELGQIRFRDDLYIFPY